MKSGEYLPAFVRVILIDVTLHLQGIAMFLEALVDSKNPGYQKHDIDFLIGDLMKQATTRNTDRVSITSNNRR